MRTPTLPPTGNPDIDDPVAKAMLEFDKRWHPVTGPSIELRDDIADALAQEMGITDLLKQYEVYEALLPTLRAWCRWHGEVSAYRAMTNAPKPTP